MESNSTASSSKSVLENTQTEVEENSISSKQLYEQSVLAPINLANNKNVPLGKHDTEHDSKSMNHENFDEFENKSESPNDELSQSFVANDGSSLPLEIDPKIENSENLHDNQHYLHLNTEPVTIVDVVVPNEDLISNSNSNSNSNGVLDSKRHQVFYFCLFTISLKVDRALEFLECVRKKFIGQPKIYNDFVSLMRSFKNDRYLFTFISFVYFLIFKLCFY